MGQTRGANERRRREFPRSFTSFAVTTNTILADPLEAAMEVEQKRRRPRVLLQQ